MATMLRRRTPSSFPHLLSEGRIGPITIPNRVLLSAMDMNVCVDGEIEQSEIEHYTARAAGGTGMIITGAAAVGFPVGATSTKEPGLSDDRFIPGLRALADAVHAAGSKLCIQSTHHGKIARVDTNNDRPLLVPSEPTYDLDMSALADNTRDELTRLGAVTGGKRPTYHEATLDDLRWLVETWTQAAIRCREAGVDAIEIHCAHGYVLGGFLNRADNHRTDEYGGSLANRARLACEVIASVKAAVGDRMAVLVRVAGEEYGPAAGQEAMLTLAETIEAVALFEKAGADAIDVTGWGRNPFSNFTDGPLPNKVGAYLDNAAEIKKHVSIPVIAVGRMLPELAEEALGDGRIDFVAMGRQLLADPELVAKIRAGKREQVRPCINCYVCVQENFYDDTPICAVNPALGDEALLPFVRTAAPKNVVVVGAGPAGLESARILTERGHFVTVLESGDRLGGTLWFSTLTTPDNERLLRWLRHEVDRLGIDVRLRTTATPETLRALRPDVVIVATGAKRPRPEIPGGDLPHVYTGDSLRHVMAGTAGRGDANLFLRAIGRMGALTGITKSPKAVREVTKLFMPIGHNVVVVGGSLVGLELAEYLAHRGRSVTLLEEGATLGLPMAMPRRWTAVKDAKKAGVTLRRKASATRITEDRVFFASGDDTDEKSAPADVVIMAAGTYAAAPLADDLRASGFDDVRVVGDASAVDYIEGAIHTAWKVATAI